ncbi:hypothetical protein Poly51_39900 [Rubripirellula tenax]|uniref:Uncharacterized protein n=1 Tax=Rubripirellula tenax TaxID=2528015 RepID=A0A5C6ERK8_9BACT|nr:hypothetical protein [Rubripirellula tenax]TWU50697.1 hypothetical protein Poly51_39900 [Rubripirellula tenax]
MTHFDQFLLAVRDLPPNDDLFGGDYLINPPNPDYGYHSTPLNALTFSTMGVDGVHTAILTEEGRVTDDSPVVYVSPLDSDDCSVIAKNFLAYLADGCGVPETEMVSLLAQGSDSLIAMIRDKFDSSSMLDDSRLANLGRLHGDRIVRRPL